MTPSLPRYIFQHHASPVVYCGFVVCAGTSNEEPDDLGMAHFLEHMSFKGTRRRRAYHINSFLERVGGDLNAFTNKVETVFHATVLRRDFARAVDLLADVVFNSQYPEHEIQREVEVICDEIDSYEDSPSELIFDHFEQILFKGHPLGRDILGTKERLRQYHTADAHRFASRYYRPDNVVFFAYGDLDEATVRRTLARYMPQDLPTLPQFTLPTFAPLPPHTGGDTIIVNKNTHQAHVIVGTRAVGGHDERRYALSLLNNILGGPGMNSRLTSRLREKAGLVYTIDSYLYVYPDTGVWEIYFGCDPGDVERCLKLVHDELRRIIEKPLTPTQLASAKAQLIGQMGIAADNNESYAITLGKTFAHYGKRYDPEAQAEHIRALTAKELQNAAAEFLRDESLTTLVFK